MPARNLSCAIGAAAIAALALAGCRPPVRLRIHYLHDFVPGAERIFKPAKIAIAPVAGPLANGEIAVGAVYAADGRRDKALAVSNAGAAFGRALAGAMADAGLVPIAIDSAPTGGRPRGGADFLLTAKLEQFEVNKHFGAARTVHGQYFTMRASVRAKIELRNRGGAMVYAGEVIGTEDEPPAPARHEVFLPLETDPAESLSAAMSRAVGSIALQPRFRAAFAPAQ
ncbi:MAG: hypothetical protein ACREQI_11915 [Candidatus Binataceae bacterium]